MLAALVASVVIAGTVVLLRRRFVVVRVIGTSMEPALRDGQRVLVRRAGVEAVEPGDLVVFAFLSVRTRIPVNPPWMIKRAVAIPGDPVPRDSVPPPVHARHARVPAGRLVVRGDNPAESFDSRRAGFIDGSELLGIVVRALH